MLLRDLVTRFVLLVTGFKFDLRLDAGSACVDVHGESLFTHAAIADLIQNCILLGLKSLTLCIRAMVRRDAYVLVMLSAGVYGNSREAGCGGVAG